MGCLGFLLPIFGLIGFYNSIIWMFYFAGGLAAIYTAMSIISGESGCLNTLLFCLCYYFGYNATGSLVEGFMLGSCLASIYAVAISFVMLVIHIGFMAALAALFSMSDWFRKK